MILLISVLLQQIAQIWHFLSIVVFFPPVFFPVIKSGCTGFPWFLCSSQSSCCTFPYLSQSEIVHGIKFHAFSQLELLPTQVSDTVDSEIVNIHDSQFFS